MRSILFIGLVWPEPTSSAAGTRILQLLNLFREAGDRVTFACAAARSPHSYPLMLLHVQEVDIQLNDSSFDAFVQELNPDIVVFDRFMVEEQYGWRVRCSCPSALTMLDTEDLHFLRAARQEAVKKNRPIVYHSDLAKREIAAILRCDLSLIIAQQELRLLSDLFHIPTGLLYYLPFLEEPITDATARAWNIFENRKHLLFIGNFMHEPNWHTVQYLKMRIWPLLKERLPDAELHIYGSYATEKVYQLQQAKDRFYIKGRAGDAKQTMAHYRLLLAPIQFGAGAKGKFVDAMQSGTPSVTTTIGAESMMEDGTWGGVVEDRIDAFVERAAHLYRTKDVWEGAQQEGRRLLNLRYSKDLYQEAFLQHLNNLQRSLVTHRQDHFIGQILQTQQLNSSMYMSRWIEEKNKYR